MTTEAIFSGPRAAPLLHRLQAAKPGATAISVPLNMYDVGHKGGARGTLVLPGIATERRVARRPRRFPLRSA